MTTAQLAQTPTAESAKAAEPQPAPARTADLLDTLAWWRLRPGVAVTALRGGLHLRGPRASVTLEGSPALPALWQLLAPALGAGEQLDLLERAPVGSPLRGALITLITQLHAHELLVARSPQAPDAPQASRWLRAVAERPAEAAAALAGTRPLVLSSGGGADAGGPLARAAARALARGGTAPATVTDASLPAGQVVLAVFGSWPLAVCAGVSGATGFVTAPGSPEQARADAAALAARLLDADPAAEVTQVARTARASQASRTARTARAAAPARAAQAAVEPPAALLALVAGAAAQRLLCAAAGLPDSAADGDDQRLLAERPAVLVAQARPLGAEYHPWLGPDLLDADRAATVAAPRTMAEALRRTSALGDPQVGVLAAPLPGALPQLPAALVGCPVAGGTLFAGAARTDLARLDAICRAAELRLTAGADGRRGAGSGQAVTVGADPGHAWGRALRRAAECCAPLGGELPEESWSQHPQARYWWTTLSERLGVRGRLSVRRLSADDSAFLAEVRCPSGASAPDRVLGRAVEATAADAAAFAALATVGHVLTVAEQLTTRQESWPSGAVAPIAAAGVELAGWEDESWTAGWLAALAAREPALQSALRRLTDLRAEPWEPAGPDQGAVAAALHGCGFTVLRTAQRTAGGTR